MRLMIDNDIIQSIHALKFSLFVKLQLV